MLRWGRDDVEATSRKTLHKMRTVSGSGYQRTARLESGKPDPAEGEAQTRFTSYHMSYYCPVNECIFCGPQEFTWVGASYHHCNRSIEGSEESSDDSGSD